MRCPRYGYGMVRVLVAVLVLVLCLWQAPPSVVAVLGEADWLVVPLSQLIQQTCSQGFQVLECVGIPSIHVKMFGKIPKIPSHLNSAQASAAWSNCICSFASFEHVSPLKKQCAPGVFSCGNV
jgi:hypothetical protein